VRRHAIVLNGITGSTAFSVCEKGQQPQQALHLLRTLRRHDFPAAAIDQGFAVDAAAQLSLTFAGALTVRAEVEVVDVLAPWAFAGLLWKRCCPTRSPFE